LSRKQFDAGKRARKDLMRDILNSKNGWLKFFFSISTRRLAESVEGLNSSLAAGNLWPKKCGPICGLARLLKG